MGEHWCGPRSCRESARFPQAGKGGRGRSVLLACALPLAVLAALMAFAAPNAAAQARRKTTIGTEIRSISPRKDASKAGWTRLVVLDYACGSSSMGRPLVFTASNSRTVFIRVANQFASRVTVPRNSFVRFWPDGPKLRGQVVLAHDRRQAHALHQADQPGGSRDCLSAQPHPRGWRRSWRGRSPATGSESYDPMWTDAEPEAAT